MHIKTKNMCFTCANDVDRLCAVIRELALEALFMGLPSVLSLASPFL